MSNKQLATLQGMLKEAALAGRPAAAAPAAAPAPVVDAPSALSVDGDLTKAAMAGIEKAAKAPAPVMEKQAEAAALRHVVVDAGFEGHMAQLFKMSGQVLASGTQDTKQKKTQEPTKPGVVRLESASDEKPKKAPEKKPEEGCSENKNEYEKEASPRGLGGLMAAVEQAIRSGKAGTVLKGLGSKAYGGAKALGSKALGGAKELGGKALELGKKPLPLWAPAAGVAGTAGAAALGAHALSDRPGGPKPEDLPQGSDVSKSVKDTRSANKQRVEGDIEKAKTTRDSDVAAEQAKAQQKANMPVQPTENVADADRQQTGKDRAAKDTPPDGGGAPTVADTPQKQDLIAAIREGLGNFGGSTMGAVGGVAGKLGMPSIEEWLAQRAQGPESQGLRELVGGGTAVGGTALAAYLASKLLGSGKEASHRPPLSEAYRSGYALGMAKISYEMGRAVNPPQAFKDEEVKELTPKRLGIKGTTRRGNQARLEALTR